MTKIHSARSLRLMGRRRLVTPSREWRDLCRMETSSGIKGVAACARLLASGNSPDGCDASDTEESMGLFSASACGLYGFADSALIGTGKTGECSTLTLVSRRRSPKIWAHGTALLEVLPGAASLVSE